MIVANDVAARGLDIESHEVVINLDISPDPPSHTKRIDRTARHGQAGLARSLVSMDGMGPVGRIGQFMEVSSS